MNTDAVRINKTSEDKQFTQENWERRKKDGGFEFIIQLTTIEIRQRKILENFYFSSNFLKNFKYFFEHIKECRKHVKVGIGRKDHGCKPFSGALMPWGILQSDIEPLIDSQTQEYNLLYNDINQRSAALLT